MCDRDGLHRNDLYRRARSSSRLVQNSCVRLFLLAYVFLLNPLVSGVSLWFFPTKYICILYRGVRCRSLAILRNRDA